MLFLTGPVYTKQQSCQGTYLKYTIPTMAIPSAHEDSPDIEKHSPLEELLQICITIYNYQPYYAILLLHRSGTILNVDLPSSKTLKQTLSCI